MNHAFEYDVMPKATVVLTPPKFFFLVVVKDAFSIKISEKESPNPYPVLVKT